MPDLTFNTKESQTIARDLQILYMNTGTGELPVWSPVGMRVDDSAAEYDWSRESKQDIVGATRNSLKKPVITQTFDPWDLSNGDVAQVKLWNLAIRDQDSQALAALDMLVVHKYAGTADTAVFAERYDACSVEVTGLGGAGGGNITMPITVTYGGVRTVGTAKVSGGSVTFNADGSPAL